MAYPVVLHYCTAAMQDFLKQTIPVLLVTATTVSQLVGVQITCAQRTSLCTIGNTRLAGSSEAAAAEAAPCHKVCARAETTYVGWHHAAVVIAGCSSQQHTC